MSTELHKLRISKEHKARHDDRPLWPWMLLVLLLIGAGLGIWKWRQGTAVISVEVLRVRVPEGAVLENDLVKLNATGYITAAHRIELASKVLGRVAWVGVEMGDKVEKDQVLVRLEDDEYKAHVAQALGQLNNAKALLAQLKAGARPQEIAQLKAQLDSTQIQMESAQRSYERELALKDKGNVSKQDLDDAETLMNSRKAQVESTRQQYEMMKAGPRQEEIDAQAATVAQLEGALAQSTLDLENTVIKSPIASTILERNVEQGEFVTTGFVGDHGAKGYVVAIADLNDLRVELDISQNDFAKVTDNQPCWITTDAYPDRKYNGTVDLISPVANRQKATILVRVRVLNPDALLKPDMNATVSFLSQEHLAAAAATSQPAQSAREHPAIRIPASALHEGSVFVLENGKALRRGVTVGLTATNGDVEIRKGLIGGEDLIIKSAAPLHEGDAVQVSQNPK